MNIIMKHKRDLELVPFQIDSMFKSFLSLVINHLANSDAFIQRGFRDIQEMTINEIKSISLSSFKTFFGEK